MNMVEGFKGLLDNVHRLSIEYQEVIGKRTQEQSAYLEQLGGDINILERANEEYVALCLYFSRLFFTRRPELIRK